jgi:hypothetical protein
MRMFEAWAVWSDNQQGRIADGTVKRESKEKPAATLTQLNERVLHDIGLSRLGFPVGCP